MKCKQGDQAYIIFSIRPENIGREVSVADYIGHFNQGELFQFRGMACKAVVTDHYWWIEAQDLSIQLGPSPRAYIADSWLEPIKPEQLKETEEEIIEIVV